MVFEQLCAYVEHCLCAWLLLLLLVLVVLVVVLVVLVVVMMIIRDRGEHRLSNCVVICVLLLLLLNGVSVLALIVIVVGVAQSSQLILVSSILGREIGRIVLDSAAGVLKFTRERTVRLARCHQEQLGSVHSLLICVQKVQLVRLVLLLGMVMA